jgi:hypothetical protein
MNDLGFCASEIELTWQTIQSIITTVISSVKIKYNVKYNIQSTMDHLVRWSILEFTMIYICLDNFTLKTSKIQIKLSLILTYNNQTLISILIAHKKISILITIIYNILGTV